MATAPAAAANRRIEVARKNGETEQRLYC